MGDYAYRKEDKIKRAREETKKQGEKLGLNRFIQLSSISMLVDIWEKDLIQGRRVDYMAQIVLLIKSRKTGIPICIPDLNMKNRTAKKYLKTIEEEMDLKIDRINTLEIIEYLTPDENIHELARKIKEKIGRTRRSPRAEASGILYLIIEDHCIRDDITEVTGISKVTLRKTYREIKEKLDNPDQYKYDYGNIFTRTLKFKEAE